MVGAANTMDHDEKQSVEFSKKATRQSNKKEKTYKQKYTRRRTNK